MEEHKGESIDAVKKKKTGFDLEVVLADKQRLLKVLLLEREWNAQGPLAQVV